jgi:hypothetical protein
MLSPRSKLCMRILSVLTGCVTQGQHRPSRRSFGGAAVCSESGVARADPCFELSHAVSNAAGYPGAEGSGRIRVGPVTVCKQMAFPSCRFFFGQLWPGSDFHVDEQRGQ